MLFFKKVDLSETDGQHIEKAIRKYALKQNTPLDLHSSATLIGQEKYFLGFETAIDNS